MLRLYRPEAARVRTTRNDVADLDIGVIYTRERQYVEPLVLSLRDSAESLQLRLILVDNDSGEDVGGWANLFESHVVLQNAKRLTYAENLNRIVSAASAPYVLLLNTDMEFDPSEQCLEKMVRFMDSHPECGVSGCRLYHADGSYAYPARRFQSLKTIAARRLGLARALEGELRSYLYQDSSPEDVIECDWLSGCFLMARLEAIRDIQGFDEGFRKYFEDVDLCLRMRRAGWRVMFNGGTHGLHFEQRSSRKLLSIDALHHAKSYMRWLRKWGLDPARHLAGSDFLIAARTRARVEQEKVVATKHAA